MIQNPGNFGTTVARPLGSVTFKTPGPSQELNVFFSTRNGFWTELLRLRKIGDTWTSARIVTGSPDPQRFLKGAILFEQINKQFPLSELQNDSDWLGVEKLPRAF